MAAKQPGAQGCILGALLGDAIGAHIEFISNPTGGQIDEACRLPGGGRWGLSRGQVTDDGELTLACMRGIMQYVDAANRKVSAAGIDDFIAAKYVAWAASSPFDIGFATRQALSHPGIREPEKVRSLAALVRSQALANKSSKSNGGLMRCTPLALFGHRLDLPELKELCAAETSLTHPDPVVQCAVFLYVALIGQLIATPGVPLRELYDDCLAPHMSEFPEVQQWVDAVLPLGANQPAKRPQNSSNTGYIGLAFQLALYQLFRVPQLPFLDAMKETLEYGGDTDTNCCIVGGLLGARCGLGKMPQDLVQLVLECTTHAGDPKRKRPNEFVPGRCLLGEINALLDVAPLSLSAMGK
jgi:ADP-ribosyl-[dinitrogen reductase] hydrolase